MRKLHHFHGGIHPPSNKTQSTRTAIARAPLPSRLIVPLHQHAGETAKPVVQAGDHVLKGQLIGMPDGFVSSAVHAPTSGTIAAVDMQLIAHPSGLPNLCATLIPDGKDEWIARKPVDYREPQPRRVAASAAHGRCGGPGRRGLPQRPQAAHRQAEDHHADPERRGVRALHHLRRHADARTRRRDRAGRGNAALHAGCGRSADRRRGQQAGSDRRDATGDHRQASATNA